MFNKKIGNEYMVFQNGSSEGTQVKFRKDNFWYKKDSQGNEGLAEYLASGVLRYSNLKKNEFVEYEMGMINGKSGCRSRNFLPNGWSVITFYRLYYNEFGKNLAEVIAGFDSMEERIEYVIRFIKQSCGLDVRDYLKKTITLDMLILNEDRHLNNLAVIFAEDHFKIAPVFDNGISLLTANKSVNWKFGLEDNVKRVIARPFCGSHEKMVRYLGIGLKIDYKKLYQWLTKVPASREKDVLCFQLERYKKALDSSSKGELEI